MATILATKGGPRYKKPKRSGRSPLAFSCLFCLSSSSDVLLLLLGDVSRLSSSPCHRHGSTILVICAGFFTLRFQLVRLGMTAVQLGYQHHLMGTARWVANSHLQAESTELAKICGPRAQRACDDAQPLRGSLSKPRFRKRTCCHGTQSHGNAQQHHNDLPELGGPTLGKKIGARTPDTAQNLKHLSTLRKISNTCHKNVSWHLQSKRLMVVIQLTPRTSVFVRAAIKWCSKIVEQ